MDDLVNLALQNSIAALALAVVVYGVTRVWRSAPVAHVLWLLVLVKLVAPPVMRVDWPPLVPTTGRTEVRNDTRVADRSPSHSADEQTKGRTAEASESVGTAVHTTETTSTNPVTTSSGVPASSVDAARWSEWFSLGWRRARPIVLTIWFGGTLLWSIMAILRIFGFHCRLQETLPAPIGLLRRARELAEKMGIRQPPDVRIAASIDVPMVWCLGRRLLVVMPIAQLGDGSDEKTAMILAHELAHIVRRDHWVRRIELFVSLVYWWNPLVWAVRRQIHDAEDECCDAWVDWLFPNRAGEYAELLLESAERATSSRTRLPELASPFLRSHSLKARIAMILEGRLTRRLSRRSMVALCLLAAAILPTFLQSTTGARAEAGDPLARPALEASQPASERSNRIVAQSDGPSKEKKNAPEKSATTILKYGDGKADGRKSLGGSGEMIRFEMPEGVTKIRGIKIHGSRYGYPQPPNEDFEITFLSDDFSEVLHAEKAPYALFQRGNSKWVNVRFKEALELPKAYWIVLNFHAEPTKGVYVSYDISTKGEHSRIGLGGDDKPRAVDFGGDWMVQVVTTR